MSASYVKQKDGKAIIIFVGSSDELSTKDCIHLKTKGRYVREEVHFSITMALQTRIEEFLCNMKNKQRFVQMLSERLQQEICDIFMKREISSFFSSFKQLL